MRLYSPVDLTGNMNMIEKLVLGGTGTGDLPILTRRSNPCAIKSRHQVTVECDLLVSSLFNIRDLHNMQKHKNVKYPCMYDGYFSTAIKVNNHPLVTLPSLV